MSLRGKNILLISPEHWDHIFVSKHYYAIHLARRGNRVYFLNPPGSLERVTRTEYENVFTVDYTGFVRGLRFLPGVVQLNFFRKTFKHLQALCDTQFDIVWSFDNSVFFNLSFLSDSVLKIAHIVDMNQDFNFRELAASSDICLGVSGPIVSKLLRSNSKSFYIHHGVALRESGEDVVFEKGATTLHAGYVGNLDLKYIDWLMFEEIISSNEDVTFYFVGPFSGSSAAISSIQKYPNVKMPGKMAASHIPGFLRQMDVLLLLYRVEEFPDQLTNSHKVMEYLESGKVIVSSWLDDYKEYPRLIEMTRNREDIPTIFQQVKTAIDAYNSDEMMEQRKGFAREHSYDCQIERIERLIENELSWRW